MHEGLHERADHRVACFGLPKTIGRKNDNRAMDWYKSSYCADSSCIEVAKIGTEAVGLRDSKHPERPFLSFERAGWSACVKGIKSGQFDGH